MAKRDFTFMLFIVLPLLATTTGFFVNESEILFEIGPKQVNRFSGVGNQEVFHWPVAESTGKFLYRWSGTVNQTGSGISVECSDVNVSVVVRQHGIPLPNPRETFIPDQTFVHSDGNVFSGHFVLSRLAQGREHDIELSLNRSVAGHYFAAVFLPYNLKRIDVAGLTKNCHYYVTLKVYRDSVTSSNSGAIADRNTGSTLTRKQNGLFDVHFLAENAHYNLTSNQTRISWDVLPVTDSGGTMRININALKATNASSQNISVTGCLRNAFSKNNSLCDGDILKLNDSYSGKAAMWYFPFPTSGSWHLDLSVTCNAFNNDSCDNLLQTVELSVSIGTCIDNCNADKRQGYCSLYRTDDVLFSACVCKAGWKGLACNDGRDALSYYTQLLHTLLLTLSNLMFLPCVALAIYRKFFTEALVYFFVAFMSSFYHACDQPGVVVYCIMPYETLQFSDFLSSITAIWFTLVAVAKLPPRVESWFHVAGCLGFAVGVSYNRFNLWTTVVPAVVGVIIVVTSWVTQCKKRKHCYPGLRKIIFSIIPGLICAGVGLSLYAFVETSDNYYIVHSCWHILMASAVLFLLPIGPKNKTESYKLVESIHPSPVLIFNTTSNHDDNIIVGTYSNSSLNL